MLAHQATLDYVNQPLQTCSTEEGQRGRCEHNQFAEEQGRLNHQWLSLQETLNSQVRNQTVTKLFSFLWNFLLNHMVFISRSVVMEMDLLTSSSLDLGNYSLATTRGSLTSFVLELSNISQSQTVTVTVIIVFGQTIKFCLTCCSGPGAGGGAEEQGGAGGPTAADQPLDHRSEPLDRLGSDTQQPGGAAKEHRRLPGQRSHLCQNAWTKVQV